jgi:hypothetical protein
MEQNINKYKQLWRKKLPNGKLWETMGNIQKTMGIPLDCYINL